MGDRYFLTFLCPSCKFEAHDIYYAPTCGFTNWKCPGCSIEVDLGKLCGITYEEASNRDEIARLARGVLRQKES